MTKPNLDPRLAGAGGALVLASAALVAFLGNWEGTDGRVVADALAGGLPTACGGITKHTSPYPVIVGDFWSPEKCREVLGRVASGEQLSLLKCVTAPDLTQNEFDALTSHAHNFGVAATCASRAVGLINAGRKAEGCHAISTGPKGEPVWSYVKKPDGTLLFVKGLANRRHAEEALCLKK